MATPRKIRWSDRELLVAIEQGATIRALAGRFGCTESAVRQRVRQARRPRAALPGAERPAALPSREAVAALGENLAHLVMLKRACLAQMGLREAGEASDLAAPAPAFRAKDPEALLLSTMGQLRQHIELAVRVAGRVYNQQEMEQFEEELIDVVEAADPTSAARIRTALQESRLLEPGPDVVVSSEG